MLTGAKIPDIFFVIKSPSYPWDFQGTLNLHPAAHKINHLLGGAAELFGCRQQGRTTIERFVRVDVVGITRMSLYLYPSKGNLKEQQVTYNFSWPIIAAKKDIFVRSPTATSVQASKHIGQLQKEKPKRREIDAKNRNEPAIGLLLLC